MDNNLRIDEQACRKQITFDLSENRLEEIYPRSQKATEPRYYKKAWTDIGRFMVGNDFEHRQYSVYVSKTQMTAYQVSILVTKMAICMPWICDCLEAIDVTNIGEQHDLMDFMKTLRKGLEPEQAV